jgi:hypothetical protein
MFMRRDDEVELDARDPRFGHVLGGAILGSQMRRDNELDARDPRWRHMAKVAGAVGGGALLGNMFMRRDDEVELDARDPRFGHVLGGAVLGSQMRRDEVELDARDPKGRFGKIMKGAAVVGGGAYLGHMMGGGAPAPAPAPAQRRGEHDGEYDSRELGLGFPAETCGALPCSPDGEFAARAGGGALAGRPLKTFRAFRSRVRSRSFEHEPALNGDRAVETRNLGKILRDARNALRPKRPAPKPATTNPGKEVEMGKPSKPPAAPYRRSSDDAGEQLGAGAVMARNIFKSFLHHTEHAAQKVKDSGLVPQELRDVESGGVFLASRSHENAGELLSREPKKGYMGRKLAAKAGRAAARVSKSVSNSVSKAFAGPANQAAANMGIDPNPKNRKSRRAAGELELIGRGDGAFPFSELDARGKANVVWRLLGKRPTQVAQTAANHLGKITDPTHYGRRGELDAGDDALVDRDGTSFTELASRDPGLRTKAGVVYKGLKGLRYLNRILKPTRRDLVDGYARSLLLGRDGSASSLDSTMLTPLTPAPAVLYWTPDAKPDNANERRTELSYGAIGADNPRRALADAELLAGRDNYISYGALNADNGRRSMVRRTELEYGVLNPDRPPARRSFGDADLLGRTELKYGVLNPDRPPARRTEISYGVLNPDKPHTRRTEISYGVLNPDKPHTRRTEISYGVLNPDKPHTRRAEEKADLAGRDYVIVPISERDNERRLNVGPGTAYPGIQRTSDIHYKSLHRDVEERDEASTEPINERDADSEVEERDDDDATVIEA